MRGFQKSIATGVGVLWIFVFTVAHVRGDRSHGVELSTSNWTTRIEGEQQTPGIAKGTIEKFTLMMGTPPGVTLAVWADGNISARGDGRHGEATYIGSIQGRNGSKVSIEVKTTNGSTASVKIGSKEFTEVSDALFLISTENAKKPRVKKLKLDAKKFPNLADVEAIVKYAQEQKAIVRFWQKTKPASSVKE